MIERPHLLEILRRALDRKLALVHGPAGFGKTTLAAQWHGLLRAEGISTAWLGLDAGDNDREQFVAYLIEAIRSVEPDLCAGLTEVIEANPGTAIEFALDNIVSEFSLHGAEFVLFIDDWHLIHERSIHDALQLLIHRAPPNVHLVVTSRSRQGIPMMRLRVQDELVEINTRDLRFGLEESRSFLAEAKALPIDSADVLRLWQSTEGWAAALQLASISLREGGREQILQWETGTSNDIGEYLAENVLASLPTPLVDFMLKTSILGRLSGDLCRAVTGEVDSFQLIESLERRELFLLPIDEEHQWFRYHHLFARFLERRLLRDLAAEVPGLHHAAACWFSDHGHTAEAVDHALAAGDIDLAVDIVERDAMSLVQHSYMSSLRHLVSRLPAERLIERPKLQMAIAWAASLTHHPAEAVEALRHVCRVAATRPPDEQRILLGEANVVLSCAAVYADDIEQVEALVTPCLDNDVDYPPWVVGVAANVLAYRYIHIDRMDAVPPLIQWGRGFQDRALGLFSSVYGYCFAGMAASKAGRLRAARTEYEAALDVARNHAGDQSNAARLAAALLGQACYEANELEDAERLLEESRFLGFEGGVTDFYLATFIATCRLRMLQGDSAGAFAILLEGEETARHLNLYRLGVEVGCERVRCALSIGDLREAERALLAIETRHQAATRLPSDDITGCIEMARARLLLARGQPAPAIALLRGGLARAQAAGRKCREIAAGVLLALALDAGSHPLEAEETLALYLVDGLQRGMIRSFLDEGQRLMAMIVQLRDKLRRTPLPTAVMAQFLPATDMLTGDGQVLPAPVEGPPAPAGSFRPRELEILQLLHAGMANKEIARTLSISVDTVKWYLKGIFGKLGVSRRTQAIAEARRISLIELSPPRSGRAGRR